LLPESITGAAERFGDRVALVAGDRRMTFAELHVASNRAAAALAADGVREGTVAALTLPTGVDYVIAYLALAKLGAVTAGVNTRMSDAERARLLERLQPDILVERVEQADGAIAPLGPDPHRIVAIVFTSGTSGEPKGAVFTNRQLEAITKIDAGGLDVWGTGGPMLGGTQFCHIGFMTKLQWYLRLGCTLLVQERWRPDVALRLIEEYRMRSIGGVAAQIALLLRQPDFDDHDVSSVETIIVGGGPSPPELVREARARFGAQYSIRYSSTESGGVGTATAFDAPDEEALYTVGRPRPGVDIHIADDGELLLRSPAMMTGYWRDPDRTAATIDEDGWLHTSDLGELDDNGCLRIVGRTNDMYIRGGYNVHPLEVESVLVEHPAIAAVAVTPRPDDVMGEIGVALVVPKDPSAPPSLDDLRSFASSRLAPYKVPEGIRIVDALPITSMEKLDRAALKTAEPQVEIAPVDPDDPRAQFCLRAYFAELDQRFPSGFDVSTSRLPDAAEMRPPAGVFLLATRDGQPAGCGGLKLHGHDPAEIKRMWVASSARGLGLGRRLLEELEREAVAQGVRTVRLDTNGSLVEAIAMYRSHGYRQVERFNDEIYADLWFEKDLP
jgi:acyl-CoA synthetase (AMP-forming)/AMP-acid ligase II/ribosomal protein S18 acetylase RimI-like enzyme